MRSVVAAAARLLLEPATGSQYLYATYFVATVLVAWYAGAAPALVTFLLGLASAEWRFVAQNPATFSSQPHLLGIAFYGATGFITIAVVDAQRAGAARQ